MKRRSATGRLVSRPILTPSMKTALRLLLQAHDAAACLNQDRWDFALEIHALEKAGINNSALRSLICQGFVEHRIEQTRPGANRRSFGSPRSLRIQRRSCFVLTELGLRIVRALAAPDGHPALNACHLKGIAAGLMPIWDADRRELRLGDTVMKRFRQPARNQELILNAFQEDGWPPRIDNPLSGTGDIDALDRLHEAVKKLNRQTIRLLQFRSDGTGSGVLWQYATTGDPGEAQ